jgi:hypothetical protein
LIVLQNGSLWAAVLLFKLEPYVVLIASSYISKFFKWIFCSVSSNRSNSVKIFDRSVIAASI